MTMFDPAKFEGREMSLAHVGERVGPRLDGEDGYVGNRATRTTKLVGVQVGGAESPGRPSGCVLLRFTARTTSRCSSG